MPWHETRAVLAVLLTTMQAAGCGIDRGVPSPHETASITNDFAAALRGCTAGLRPDGSFDRRALATAGWRPVRHILAGDQGERLIPPDAAPLLNRNQHEIITAARAGSVSMLNVTRFGDAEVTEYPFQDSSLANRCQIKATLASASEVIKLRMSLSAMLGEAPQQLGELPLGGDFLGPRFDKPYTGFRWHRPQHDIQFETRGADAELHVRAALPRAPAKPPFSLVRGADGSIIPPVRTPKSAAASPAMAAER